MDMIEINEYTHIVENLGNPLLLLGSDLHILYANPAFCDAFKVSSTKLIGRSLNEIDNHKWDSPQLNYFLHHTISRDKAFGHYLLEHNSETMGRRTMLLKANRVKDKKNVQGNILLVIEDITKQKNKEDGLKKRQIELEQNAENQNRNHAVTSQKLAKEIEYRKEVQKALEISESTYKTIFETTGTATVVVNENMTIVLANKRFGMQTGYRKSEIEGNKSLLEFVVEEDTKKLMDYKLFRFIHPETSPKDFEIRMIDKDGIIKYFYLSVSGIPDTQMTVVSMLDISARKEFENKIIHIALHDTLTDLPNRQLFFDRLIQAVSKASRDKKQFALLYIDLDGFKPINDNYGHDAGDTVLKDVAHRLKSCTRKVDTVARIGGDEFAVILTDVNEVCFVENIVNNMIETINKSYNIRGNSLALGCSIGISLYPENGVDPYELMKKADQAMYRVKQKGKNSYNFS